MNGNLETSRIYLRPFVLEDTSHFFYLNSDPEVLKFTGDQPFISQKESKTFLQNYISQVYQKDTDNNLLPLGRYAIIRKEDDAWLGWCGLKYHPKRRVIDLGFRLYKKYWGQGYATESAKCWITYAFAKAKYPFLIAHSHIDNTASQKVLDRCGMKRIEQITYDNQPNYLYKIENPAYTLQEIQAEETWPVRHPVLRAGRPLEDVYMEADEKESTFHLGIFYEDKIVGVASFMEDEHKAFTGYQYRLRGMAVLPEFRKRGLAEMLLKKGEHILKDRGCTLLWFNARIIALNFYKNLDYEIVGPQFDIPLVGPHFRMKKEL